MVALLKKTFLTFENSKPGVLYTLAFSVQQNTHIWRGRVNQIKMGFKYCNIYEQTIWFPRKYWEILCCQFPQSHIGYPDPSMSLS